jgi:hypothetical protein
VRARRNVGGVILPGCIPGRAAVYESTMTLHLSIRRANLSAFASAWQRLLDMLAFLLATRIVPMDMFSLA